ncbi:hypothetical protein E1212_25225 [Jiangella ureilytica]|uniref:Uncharacterized protein n=1 Tax=Jiangella ureilytica TaxID=2530374 RepID=A0A4R4REB7_9ACTN|nr:hypothetical protein [Jiangella ureilytica]TDC47089.1 hypothetical protein E1212_25225 [Jiangella ureilytica]
MKLTKTHIPPRAAFNNGLGRRMMVGPDNTLVLDRGKLGGLALYGHCEDCRAATSPWDDEYIGWARSIADVLLDSEAVGTRPVIQVGAREVRPGRFARSALAGMTVLAENLWQTHPEFVESSRTGAPLTVDAGMRFLVGVTPLNERAEISGGHGGVLMSVPMAASADVAEPVMTLSAMVHWPPFSLVLVDARVAPTYPHVDCTSWLEWGVDDIVSPFALELPCVRIVSPIIATGRDYQPAVV